MSDQDQLSEVHDSTLSLLGRLSKCMFSKTKVAWILLGCWGGLAVGAVNGVVVEFG
jgi:hypothetical protein